MAGEFHAAAWGYSYAEIKRLERERDAYRVALHQIVNGFGLLDQPPPRDIRGARKVATDVLVRMATDPS